MHYFASFSPLHARYKDLTGEGQICSSSQLFLCWQRDLVQGEWQLLHVSYHEWALPGRNKTIMPEVTWGWKMGTSVTSPNLIPSLIHFWPAVRVSHGNSDVPSLSLSLIHVYPQTIFFFLEGGGGWGKRGVSRNVVSLSLISKSSTWQRFLSCSCCLHLLHMAVVPRFCSRSRLFTWALWSVGKRLSCWGFSSLAVSWL